MANIAQNFDQFKESFDSLREMEVEMREICKVISTLKTKNAERKTYISDHILKIYFLNRWKMVMKQIWSHLHSLQILKESIPVIRNLIESGSDFDTAMKLMENAFSIINQKLSPLHVTT